MTWCEICHGATGTTCTCPTEAPFDVATGEAPAASPEKWDESQTEDYIPTLYDPIITAAHNDNDGKGVYYVARWKAVANGLLADGKTREEAVRALLDATSDWLGVFVRTSGEPSASPEPPVGYQVVGVGCSHEGMMEVFVTEQHCRAEWPENETRALYAEPTPNSETEELPHTLGGPEISVDIGATELRAEIRALQEALGEFGETDAEDVRAAAGDVLGLAGESYLERGDMEPAEEAAARLDVIADRIDRARTAIDQAKSPTEEVGYEVKHLEPLRCQEYEDEIRALREALECALPFVAVATSHPAITHPEGIKNAEAALLRVRTALAKGGL